MKLTRIEGGAVICNFCNRVLTYNFMDRPAEKCTCGPSLAIREKDESHDADAPSQDG